MDDDRGVRTLLARVLSAAGHAVVTAQDGFEARELMNQLHPHLIILDLRMPRMSGVDYLAYARNTPVVLLSSYLDDLPPDRDTSPNIVARLQKPVPLDVLRSTVRQALKG